MSVIDLHETGRKIVGGYTSWKSPAGPFETLTSGGIKPECEPYPALYDTEGEAIDAYRAALHDYLATRPGIVYVRAEPRVESVGGKYVVRSRLRAR